MKNLFSSVITYKKQTDLISVSVTPEYQDKNSLPFENKYVWSYHICIENNGSGTIQLISRYWQIVDSFGQVRDVTGDGVVGVQPILSPGDKFEYTSNTSLPTPSGMMLGTYDMLTNTGEMVTVEIPTFSLDCPYSNQYMN